MRPEIIIVGGGFAGMYAALAAARMGGGRLGITVVSREPHLVVRPRLYEADPETLTADLAAPLNAIGVSFLQGEAASLETDSLLLLDGRRVGFDRAVVATGSVMRAPAVAGVAQTHSIDDLRSATRFDARLRKLARHPRPAIAVVGAGFSGLELALELRTRMAGHGAPDGGEGAVISLVDRADRPGRGLGENLTIPIAAALDEANIVLRMGVDIIGFDPAGISFADGTRLGADATVLCTGLVAAPFAATVVGERDELNRIRVDACLRSLRLPHLFAAGDAAASECSPGRTTLMSCQHALTTGRYAGENAARDLLGLPLVAYSQPRYVTCLDLGRSGAVFSKGWEREPKVVGAAAKAIKRRINREAIYPPRGTASEILAASSLTPPRN